ncbi:MAG TPA: hypothetical protein VGA22_05125 [Gemmatimonadales bacterium]
MSHGPLSYVGPLVLALSAGPLRAQLANVPVYANPSASGIAVGGDVSVGLNDESGKDLAFAARANLGFGKFLFGAGVGLVDFGTTEPTFMGSVGYRVAKVGFVNVAVQAGAGFTRNSSLGDVLRTADIPVSAGIGLSLPLVVATVEPWVAPRFTIQRLSADGASTWRNHVGLSAGLDVKLLVGLGAHLAVDWQALPAIAAGDLGGTITDLKRQPLLLSGGVHFGF